MQLISKFNKGARFLLFVIDIFSEYAWIVSLKDKKDITITNTFQQILDYSNCKSNKIRVNKDSEFYYKLKKSWSEDNNVAMYSTHNSGNSVVAERFIRT